MKGFRRVELAPGKEQEVTFYITEEDLRYYRLDGTFGSEPGTFTVFVFQTVKCYGCQDNDTFENELKVSINTQNRQGICQGGKDHKFSCIESDKFLTNFIFSIADIPSSLITIIRTI